MLLVCVLNCSTTFSKHLLNLLKLILHRLGIGAVDSRGVEGLSSREGREGNLEVLEVKSAKLLLAVTGRQRFHEVLGGKLGASS